MKIDKDMDMLLENMEVDFENGCGIVESLKLNDVEEKDWKEILEVYKKWEVKELGDSKEWDKEEMDKESVEFIVKNKIKWNWME
jgi:hypothetical protein